LNVKKSLLADSKNSFLWAVQIGYELDDHSPRDPEAALALCMEGEGVPIDGR
jgi:hypothetical protein